MEVSRATSSSYNSRQHSDSPDEEIDIQVKVIKTTYIKVKKSEKIRTVKSLIRETANVSEDFQELLFCGNLLKDEGSLDDYGVGHNSAVHLFTRNYIRFEVLVRLPLPDERLFAVQLTVGDTIRRVKELIHQKERIEPENFILRHSGSLLERDNEILASLNITKNSILDIVFRPQDLRSISVKMPGGKLVKLSRMEATCSIGDVKVKIRGEGLQGGDTAWVLLYLSQPLDDSKSLAFYQIRNGSILELMPCSFPVFVKAFSGRTLTINVESSLKVADLKKKINEKLNIPPRFQSLVFAGKQLQEGRSLGSYGIKMDCTIIMCH